MAKWIVLVCIVVCNFGGRYAYAKSELELLLTNIEKLRLENNIPAVGLSIVKDGEEVFSGALGIRESGRAEVVDTDTLFRVGSISKTVAGLAALKAQELGILDLKDDVAQHLGSDFLSNPWHESHPVKIIHLLEHTAGFYDITEVEFDHESSNPIALKEAFQLSPESRKVHWKPGTHSSYSNLGAPILAYIIEQRSGIKYEDFVQKYIFTPLAIQKASFLYSPHVEKNLVSGHSSDGKSVIPYWHIAYRPFGALNISPDEFTQLLLFLVHRKLSEGVSPITASNLKSMETPRSTLAAKYGLDFGYGLGVYADDESQGTLFGHGGTAAGHLAEFRYSSELKLGYLVAINKNSKAALAKITRELKQFLLDEIPRRNSLQASNEYSLENYSGYYRVVTYRVRGVLPIMNFVGLLNVTVSDQALNIRSWAGFGMTLYASEDGLFFEDGEYEPSSILILDDGKRYIQTPSWNLEEISPIRYWLSQLVLYFMLLGLLLSVIYSISLFVKAARGKLKKGQNIKVLLFPFLALSLLILPIVIQVFELPYMNLIAEHGYSLHIILSALFLVFLIGNIRQPKVLWKKISISVVALSHALIACFTLYTLLT